MEARILHCVGSQNAALGRLPKRCSSNRLCSVPERERLAVVSMSRKRPQTIRFLAEFMKKESKEGEVAELRALESPALLTADESSAAYSSTSTDSSEDIHSSTGTAALPPIVLRQINFTDRHLLVLGFIACATTGALSCILLAAIPTLIAFKKAADSLKKLADTAREELPGTMAAVRLSGMEISDLTMELSDLGQEISEGVRSSTRAVRAAEDGLRRMGSFTSIEPELLDDLTTGQGGWSRNYQRVKYQVSELNLSYEGTFANFTLPFTGLAVLQERATEQVQVVRPKVALAARSTREALVRARSLVRGLVTLTRLSKWLAQRWRMIRPWKQRSIASRVP